MNKSTNDWLDTFLEIANNSTISYRQKASIRLTGKIMVICSLVLVVFLFYNLFNRVSSIPYFLYAGYFVTAGTALILVRRGFYVHAKTLFLVSLILFIFFFSITAPYQSGTHLSLVLTILVALAMFDDGRKRVIATIVFLVFVCYLLASFPDYNPLPRRIFSTEMIRHYFIINVTIFFSCSYLILSWLLSLHKNYENELREQKEKLEEVNKNLDHIVYTVSHDLRSPLNSLQGIISIAANTSNDKERKEYNDMMEKQIVSMKNYIQDIVEYNRNAKTQVEEKSVMLADIINEVIKTIKALEDETMLFDVHVSKNVAVRSDPVRLKVILSNLIGNAVKYRDTRKNRSLVNVEAFAKDGFVEVAISDNGLGIGKEHISKLFSMFYRATDKLEGTGLGLYIVKETVEKLGGKISVTSEIDKGSVFRFTLPM